MPDARDLSSLVGLSYQEAASRVESLGLQPRRLTPDMLVTMEYNARRINLHVDAAGVVVDASRG